MSNRHLLSIEQLDKATLIHLITQAQNFSVTQEDFTFLKGRVLANLFFENSTRTRLSFELAAKRLGATVLTLDPQSSSTQKGETLIDTAKTIAAMGVDILVIRRAENHAPTTVAQAIKNVSVINAGDGTHAHPTQAILDMLTIQQHKPDFSKLKIAIIGDIRHSRVAHSDIFALRALGVAQIRAIGPKGLLPIEAMPQVQTYATPEEGLKDVDVIITLRLQKERMEAAQIPSDSEFFRSYGLTEQRLKLAKPDAIVLHPGPMNRGVEIASSIADGPQSVILQQVKNGVAARMAVMQWCLGSC